MRRASSRRGADADDARARHQSSRELAREFCRRHASRSAFSPNAPTHRVCTFDRRAPSIATPLDRSRASIDGRRTTDRIGSDRSDSRAPLRVARVSDTQTRARAVRARKKYFTRAARRVGALANCATAARPYAMSIRVPSPARQRKRRTRLEVYGVTPSRTSTRLRVNDENNEENNVSVDPVVQKYGPPPGMGGGRGRHLTERERVAIYERIVLARCNGDVSPTHVCRLWGMSHNFLQRMDAALAAGTYFVRRSATGCARQMTDAHVAIVKDINGRTRGELTWGELAAEFKKETGLNFSPSTIFRNCTRIGWTRVRRG